MESLVHLSTQWFRSYLSNRTQTVTINNKLSQPTLLKFGVPQGSVLGPILFILYTKPLTTLIRRHSISNQSFADDTQLHDSCRPDQIDTSVQGMQDCISDVKTWMTSNKLKLNDDKTECLLIVSNRTSLPNPHPTSIHIGDTDIPFSLQAKNLGVTLTNNLSMEKHVTNICRSAYIEMRRISNIRHYLTTDATKTLLCAFVLSKLDYCNSLLSGSPKHLLDKLQKVQNSAARLVFKALKHKHIKPLLQKLHWLPVVSRIQYKRLQLCATILSLKVIKPLLQKLHWLPVVSRIQYKRLQLCATILSLKVTQSIFLNSWLSTVHPDNFAPFLTPEPSSYLSQKQRPLDNEFFLSRARQSGTRYRMMFVTQCQHRLSSRP